MPSVQSSVINLAPTEAVIQVASKSTARVSAMLDTFSKTYGFGVSLFTHTVQ